jgi:membrane fusion protein, copper/silver efflux system
MKKKFSDSLLLLILLAVLAVSCGQKKSLQEADGHQYTCPMHPQIIADKPGQCPICGMDLVLLTSGNGLPIDSSLLPLLRSGSTQTIANVPSIVAEPGTKIFSVPVQGIISYDERRQVSISSRVSGRIEKLYIKYNFQQVQKGQVIMEIYSPDLVAAQRELIYIHQNDNNASLLQRARQRLLLLGMSSSQIDNIIRSGRPLYSVPVYSTVTGFIVDRSSITPAPGTSTPLSGSSTPSSADGMNGMGSSPSTSSPSLRTEVGTTPVLVREGQYVNAGQSVFNIYQAGNMVAEFYFDPSLASYIKAGTRFTYHTSSSREEIFSATIGLVEPVQREGSAFTTARVYLANGRFQPGQLLRGYIPVVARGWWLPEAALVGLGTNDIVFKKENGLYKPRRVPTGIRIQGLVQVLDSVANWQVAKNASYLVDNETFIRTTVSQ